MPEPTPTTRREFLRIAVVPAIGFATGALTCSALAGNDQKKPKAKPPKTCGGWVDRNRDGVCERSVRGQKRCKAKKCPANIDNPELRAAAKAGAPRGVCGNWDAPSRAGVCSLSTRENEPCLQVRCPAHKQQA